MVTKFSGLRVAAVLLLVVVLGAGLRFWGLDVQSLWNDELGSWSFSHISSLRSLVYTVAHWDVHPPGYYLLLHYVLKFDSSDMTLRFPSAVCGVLSIGIIFLIGRRLYSWREGLAASVLLAFLKCPIYYSQEARSYSMLLLFSLLTAYFLLLVFNYLRNNTTVPLLISCAYLFSAVMSCYLHYYGLYFVFLQGVFAIMCFCRNRRAVIFFGTIYTGILLAFAPWAAYAWQQIHEKTHSPIPRSLIDSLNSYLQFLFNDSQLFVLVVVALFLYLLVVSIREKFSEVGTELLLVGWLFVPFIGVFLVAHFTPLHIFLNRYLIISMPAAYLLFARAFLLLPASPAGQAVKMIALAVILLCHLIFGCKYYSLPTKDQFREAVNYIIKNDKMCNNSVVIGSVYDPESLNYYFCRATVTKRVNFVLKNDKKAAVQLIEHGLPVCVWYIYMYAPADTEFLSLLKAKMVEAQHKDFISGGVYLFQRRTLQNGS
ncbi:MAG: glycosyltransferase family 39 protein [Candidatus Omnitrophica bacterium]|nr:glycosyltransferase family 39 protein [Candidatus Omnitrophota bacterium]